jgi:hypothetical protein
VGTITVIELRSAGESESHLDITSVVWTPATIDVGVVDREIVFVTDVGVAFDKIVAEELTLLLTVPMSLDFLKGFFFSEGRAFLHFKVLNRKG